jgi:PKD repeat protein
MIRLIFTFLALQLISFSFGQHIDDVGCGQHKLLRELLKSPERLKLHQAEQKQLLALEKNGFANRNKGVIYTIPVVFHLIHNGGVENISDAQILDGLASLNKDFRKLNPDTSTVSPLFQSISADVEINFELATTAPDGSCFSGITHTLSPYSYVSDFSGGVDQINAITVGNEVYNGNWSSHNYLNVIICGNPSDGVAGYTNYPSNSSGTSMENAIWMRHDYVGSFGTSSPGRRTLSHEAGHWLNLPHTWGSTNDPGLASNCNSDDNVIDTPNTIGSTWCNQNDTACGPYANTENYMNYASCRKMFTVGQANRMRTALNSAIGGRDNLWQPSNLISTGTNAAPNLCKANFKVDKPVICLNDTINFSDESFHNVTSWNWSFPGGNPSTSSQQNPSVAYSAPGIYEVSLTASDGSNSMTETKSNFISVLSFTGSLLPYQEGFENSLDIQENWFSNSNWWAQENNASSNGSSSMKLNNLLCIEGLTYELESNTIDLSNETAVTIGFKYAYANRSSTNYDMLQLLASKDCGETWYVRKSISNNQLVTAFNTNSPFLPQPSDWEQVYVSNITNSYCIENFRFKFSFSSGGGNNLFIDDINIFPSSALGVLEAENSTKVFPNPSLNKLNIESTQQLINVTIYDLYGKLISESKQINSSTYLLNIESWSAGFYIVKINLGNTIETSFFEKL